MRNYVKAVVIAALLSAGAVHAAAPQWTLSETTGNVNVLRAGVSKIAVTGSILQPGDVVAAGAKSRAVLVRGEEYVAVSPNSRVRINQPKAEGGVVQFFQEIGNAIFRIDKKATPHFGVETPYLAAVVKGTTFSVTVTDVGAAVQVTEGAVQVATLDGGATQLLQPGMIGIVDRAQQFRLTISGARPQVIDSPNAPAGSSETPQPMDEATLLDIASSGFEGTISAAIAETPVPLGVITNGLVHGGGAPDTAVRMAFNDNAGNDNAGINGVAGKAPADGRNGVFGNNSAEARGPSDDRNETGNGNGGGEGNGGASEGQGNGNGSGNGNGNGNGNDGGGNEGGRNGGDGGNGNGNAEGGGNGSGNDGGGSGGDGNGNGIGNGNGGGNDNGNGNGGGNGGGNKGNGKGNAGGNGTGNEGGGNGGGSDGGGGGDKGKPRP